MELARIFILNIWNSYMFIMDYWSIGEVPATCIMINLPILTLISHFLKNLEAYIFITIFFLIFQLSDKLFLNLAYY